MNPTGPLQPWPMRLQPGVDLRRALEQALAERGLEAAFVMAGIGSLRPACLRFAGQARAQTLDADFELLSLCGTLSLNGAHLHASVSDAHGAVLGGHLGYGSVVRTTAEVLLGGLPGWQFAREPDPASGWSELVVRRSQAD